MKIDWKPIILYGGGGGGLFGLWTSFWIAGFLTLWDQGLLYPGISLSDQNRYFMRVSPERALALAGDLFHINLPHHLPGFVMAFVFVCAVFGAFLVSVSRLISLDPDSTGLRSYIWTLRSMLTWQALLLCLVPSVMLFVAAWVDSSAMFIAVIAGLVISSFLVIPITVCRPAAVSGPQSIDWKKPEWPGFSVIGMFLGIELINFSSDYLGSLVPNVWFPFTALVFTVSLALSTIAPLLQGTLLLASASSETPNYRSVFRWGVLGPWLALGFWMLGIPALCLGPFLACYIWLWKVVPLLAAFLEGQGSGLPFVFQLVIIAMNIVGRYFWMIVMVPFALIFWIATSRFIAGFDQYSKIQDERDIQGAHGPGSLNSNGGCAQNR
jgi:hypothetical protein